MNNEKLLEFIRSKAEKINDNREDEVNNTRLLDLFKDSIDLTMEEIKTGSNSTDFSDLVIINFIIKSAKEGYSSVEIKEFLKMNFLDC